MEALLPSDGRLQAWERGKTLIFGRRLFGDRWLRVEETGGLFEPRLPQGHNARAAGGRTVNDVDSAWEALSSSSFRARVTAWAGDERCDSRVWSFGRRALSSHGDGGGGGWHCGRHSCLLSAEAGEEGDSHRAARSSLASLEAS